MLDRRLTESWEGRPQNALKRNASLRAIISSHSSLRLEDKTFCNAAACVPDYLLIDIYRLVGSFWVTKIESQHLYLSWLEKYYQKEITKQKEEIFGRSSLHEMSYQSNSMQTL